MSSSIITGTPQDNLPLPPTPPTPPPPPAQRPSRSSASIHNGADAIIALMEDDRASIIKLYDQELSALHQSINQLQYQCAQLKAESTPELVSNAELKSRLHTLQSQFDEYRTSSSQELNAAVAAKAGSAEILKSLTARLGEKETYIKSLVNELNRVGLHQDGHGFLRFTGEWQSFVGGLIQLQTPEGQTPIQPEYYPLEPISLLRFLQHTHKAYTNTVRHLQERCSMVERERDHLHSQLQIAAQPIHTAQPDQATAHADTTTPKAEPTSTHPSSLVDEGCSEASLTSL